jgi:endo-1,4-beta-xylanase
MQRRWLVGSLAMAALPVQARNAASAAMAQGAGLREIAARRGIAYGCAVHTRLLRRHPAYAAAIAREAGLLVPEGEGKWDDLQPERGRFDLSGLDEILGFAARHGQAVRGHTLVWHDVLPRWVRQDGLTPASAEATLLEHIAGVLARTSGRIADWDVVNEAIADPDVLPGQDLRDSIWFRVLGERYLDIAFRAARRADPAVRLVLNDHGLEPSWARADEKRARMLRTLRGMLARGVPVQAVGIQAHMALDQPFAPPPFARFLRELRGMGLDVLLTEHDVIEPTGVKLREEDIPARDAAVAERAHAVVSTALAEGCRTVLTWGLADPFSWLNLWRPAVRPDGAQVRALPLDAELRRKPMWHALARAFEGG